MKFPYVAQMRYANGATFQVGWVNANPGAKTLDFDTAFGSARMDPFFPFDLGFIGEVPNRNAAFNPGTISSRLLGEHVCGTIDQWQNGYPIGTPGPPLGPDGIPLCCGGEAVVTSVGLALPVTEFVVTGSPVTGSGTLTGAWISQAQNTVFAGPQVGAGIPSFRLLVNADIPNLDASKITTGSFPIGVIPLIPLTHLTGPGPVGSGAYPFLLQPPNTSTTPLQIKDHSFPPLADKIQILDQTGTQYGARITKDGNFSNPNITGGSGASNELFGDLAGLNMIDATNDTFVGYKAGFREDHGQKNTAVGAFALSALGGFQFDNTAVGALAGQALSAGSANTFIGSTCGYLPSFVNAVTAVGWAACGQMADYDNVTAIGKQSCYQNTGANVTALGFEAGKTNNGDGNTLIGASTGTTGGPFVNSVALGIGSQIVGSHQIMMGTSAETTVFPGPTSGIQYSDISGAPSPGSIVTGTSPVTAGLTTLFSLADANGLHGSWSVLTPSTAGSGSFSYSVTDAQGTVHTGTASFIGQNFESWDFGSTLTSATGLSGFVFLPITSFTVQCQGTGSGTIQWSYGTG